MKKYIYKKVGAFTSGVSLGNPAAYIFTGKDSLEPAQMLAVGKEHAGFVSEFVFCSESDAAEVKLTYYSSECEVDFCGHGTIATMYDLIKNDDRLSKMKEIRFETNRKGILTAYNYIASEDAIYISAPEAENHDIKPEKNETADALGISVELLDDKYPIDCINAGLTTLMVPVKELAAEISVYPDQNVLKKFCEDNDIDIILIFCMKTADTGHFAHTRVFAPKFGYLEDPATGSGNSAFGNYLLRNGMWDGRPIAIEQGGDNRVFNTVRLRHENNMILFGGGASVRIAGEYYMDTASQTI